MNKYEYIILNEAVFNGKEVEFKYDNVIYNETMWLNKKGQEGWELVSKLLKESNFQYNKFEYVFKRKLM